MSDINFYYRFKPDLSIEIICAHCSATVAITNDEFYLRDLENNHHCAGGSIDLESCFMIERN